jgi:hypothetical protein
VLGRLGLAGIPAGVALATIGATAALAVGVTATIAVTSNHDARTTVAVLTPHGGDSGGTAGPSQSPSTHPGTSAVGSSAATTSAPPSSYASTGGSAATTSSASVAAGGGTNALFSAGPLVDSGNPSWTELDVMVTAKQQLTSLEVTIKVANCPDLQWTGDYDQGADGQLSKADMPNPDGSITFSFTLNSGQAVSPGTLEFAAQFNHAAGGWNAAEDSYVVTARTAASTTDTVVQGAY